ncbi:xanthine dehydrogenase accessory protein XdhC [Aureimonas populi]|uniref:Xanthine dehydrogenase accessory protein XdhC n=1 Tax=Aureimonas populi TaxID=1701758 RepID=A0ABW5CQ00_9HYPH|nr:xanthine dehydrogenase accessory protein XdhC [Aureimonas populi]
MSPLAALRKALSAGEAAVLVTVARAQGSTPREAGAAMLVTAGGQTGTVGGGALEMEAILEARRMLAAGESASALDIPLGPAIGQCCGGRVALALERAGPALLRRMEAGAQAERAGRPVILLFGAGHTGQALARALAPLPFNLTVIDTRPERLAELPAGIARRATPLPEAEIDKAPPGSGFVVMTHDHALDFLLTARALERADPAYVGMIGSATKREKFRRHLARTGSSASIDALTLPIGGHTLRDKRPEVIAALTAAELLVRLAPLENRCTAFARVEMQCDKDSSDGQNPLVRETERHAATS